MQILMLGNSFTSSHGLPQRLGQLTGAKVMVHARGGARLAEQLNPETKMGAMTLAALRDEQWDVVVLQEMSKGPLVSEARFRRSVSLLSGLAHAKGAVPIVFATWAYAPGSRRLSDTGLGYEEMAEALDAASRRAAAEAGAQVAPVGKAFLAQKDRSSLYAADGRHASDAGAQLAAEVIALTIAQAVSAGRA